MNKIKQKLNEHFNTRLCSKDPSNNKYGLHRDLKWYNDWFGNLFWLFIVVLITYIFSCQQLYEPKIYFIDTECKNHLYDEGTVTFFYPDTVLEQMTSIYYTIVTDDEVLLPEYLNPYFRLDGLEVTIIYYKLSYNSSIGTPIKIISICRT